MPPRRGRDLVDAIAPVVEPAEQPDQHPARLGDDPLDIEVDRQRVLELGEPREPQRRQGLACRGVGGGRHVEVAVGEGQDHEVGRALPEIDRAALLV